MNMSYKDFSKITNEETIVDFWAEWCGPCKTFSPIFNEISDMYPSVNFIKINVDENQELCQELEIMSIPTLQFYSNNVLHSEIVGVITKNELIQFINENID